MSLSRVPGAVSCGWCGAPVVVDVDHAGAPHAPQRRYCSLGHRVAARTAREAHTAAARRHAAAREPGPDQEVLDDLGLDVGRS